MTTARLSMILILLFPAKWLDAQPITVPCPTFLGHSVDCWQLNDKETPPTISTLSEDELAEYDLLQSFSIVVSKHPYLPSRECEYVGSIDEKIDAGSEEIESSVLTSAMAKAQKLKGNYIAMRTVDDPKSSEVYLCPR